MTNETARERLERQLAEESDRMERARKSARETGADIATFQARLLLQDLALEGDFDTRERQLIRYIADHFSDGGEIRESIMDRVRSIV